jgi:hypothetical protein
LLSTRLTAKPVFTAFKNKYQLMGERSRGDHVYDPNQALSANKPQLSSAQTFGVTERRPCQNKDATILKGSKRNKL